MSLGSRRRFLQLIAGAPLLRWLPLPAEPRIVANQVLTVDAMNALTIKTLLPGVQGTFFHDHPLLTYFGHRTPTTPQREFPFDG